MTNQQVLQLANQAPYLPTSWLPSETELLNIADNLSGEVVEFEDEADMAFFMGNLIEALTGQRW